MPDLTGTGGEPRDPATADTGDRLRAIGVGVGLTIGAILVSLLGGAAFAVPIILLDIDVRGTAAFLVLTAAGQLGFLVVAYVYAQRHSLRIRIALPDRRDTAFAIGGTVVAFVALAVLGAVLQTLDLVPDAVIVEVGRESPTLYLGLAVLSIFVVAPIEEFLFRGVVQGRLREVFGPVAAVVGSSLLFGSIHLANYTGSVESVLAGALLIAATGTVLGAIYELTRNLAVPIITHAVFNVVQLVALFMTT